MLCGSPKCESCARKRLSQFTVQSFELKLDTTKMETEGFFPLFDFEMTEMRRLGCSRNEVN